MPNRSKRLTLLILLLIGAAAACSDDRAVISSRHTSPDGRVDALVLQVGVPPGGGLAHYVQIVPAGAPAQPRKFDDFRADGVEGLRVAWEDDRVLAIEYRQARIHHFTNFWMSREVDSFAYVVELRLKPLLPRQLGGR